ncbi:hypothetical protein RHMOL_Rhmol04G0151300 [Rhododendron molle]|uniref:Uncharacterized protein n=1 Tax=Rhododendron molle TaxID=49168 RepID=A0ACC0P1Q9_RHOML|nr:hypothetical protein RHMOL_Rhmol04G0151300 [Rhododendron molle]
MDHFLLLCTPVWSIWTRLLAWNGALFNNEALDWNDTLEMIELKIIFWARIEQARDPILTLQKTSFSDWIASLLPCNVCVVWVVCVV